MKKIINILLLVWSYSPLLSLTDDSDFSNINLNNKDKWSLRFSFFNICVYNNAFRSNDIILLLLFKKR